MQYKGTSANSCLGENWNETKQNKGTKKIHQYTAF